MGDHPNDPRNAMSRHRERGSARLKITLEEASKELGIGMPAVYCNRDKFSTIAGIARYAASRFRKRSKKLTENEGAEHIGKLLGDRAAEDWRNRWPRFDLYRCGICDRVSFQRGLCPKCGGYTPSLKLESNGDIAIRIGDTYYRWCRIIAGVSNTYVYMKDKNRWNFRPDNIQLLTQEEHEARWKSNSKL